MPWTVWRNHRTESNGLTAYAIYPGRIESRRMLIIVCSRTAQTEQVSTGVSFEEFDYYDSINNRLINLIEFVYWFDEPEIGTYFFLQDCEPVHGVNVIVKRTQFATKFRTNHIIIAFQNYWGGSG